MARPYAYLVVLVDRDTPRLVAPYIDSFLDASPALGKTTAEHDEAVRVHNALIDDVINEATAASAPNNELIQRLVLEKQFDSASLARAAHHMSLRSRYATGVLYILRCDTPLDDAYAAQDFVDEAHKAGTLSQFIEKYHS